MSLSGFIAYQRVGWTGQTPWNPTNLNIMDKGIKDNNDMIANLRSEVSALNNNIDVKNCFCKNIPNKIAVKNFPQQISAAPVLRLTFVVK